MLPNNALDLYCQEMLIGYTRRNWIYKKKQGQKIATPFFERTNNRWAPYAYPTGLSRDRSLG